MHVDPPVKALFSSIRPAEVPSDLAERRAAANATFKLLYVPEAGAKVEDHVVGEFRVRVIRPADATGDLPGLLFVHGGGWFQGDLDTAEVECGPMATSVGCVVVSVEYQRAHIEP